jgi:hypothetical protein
MTSPIHPVRGLFESLHFVTWAHGTWNASGTFETAPLKRAQEAGLGQALGPGPSRAPPPGFCVRWREIASIVAPNPVYQCGDRVL